MGQKLSALFNQTFFLPAPVFTEKDLGDLTGKVILVTGAHTGIGFALTNLLYAANATIYLAGRNPSKISTAIGDLRAAHPSSKGSLTPLILDLSDLSSIKPAVQEFLAKESRLDVLVNNAGVMWPPLEQKSAQGHEMQMATNVYGHFLLTILLKPVLAKTAKEGGAGEVRVLWAGSIGIELAAPVGGVVFETVGGKERVHEGLGNMDMYGVTKVANVMLGVEGARRWGDEGIVNVSFNPGNLETELQRHATWFQNMALKPILYPVKFGAYTELFAGWSPEITKENNGCYVLPWGRIGGYNSELQRVIARQEDGGEGKAEKLWEICWDVCKDYM